MEERDSMRHSTHRSQRSERMGPAVIGNQGVGAQTVTDRFGNTEYMSE